jgi:hypothetical protein
VFANDRDFLGITSLFQTSRESVRPIIPSDLFFGREVPLDNVLRLDYPVPALPGQPLIDRKTGEFQKTSLPLL